uniref:NADH-ubiquinone oxidoreductase chain 5 n=1 Tax=Nautilus macromphalus TaxID=34576 RepID=Q0ZFW1_NAUMA|nr:NADH dehydrogenase subunit 5 [Nautilus macromphalus]ABE26895.1 NADH dehydrogenase subunit 5 [Nautilus macromphalus]
MFVDLKFYLKASNFASLFLGGMSVSMFVFAVFLGFGCEGWLVVVELVEGESVVGDFSLVFDWVGTSFSSVVCLISMCVLRFSSSYMSGDEHLGRFVWLVMLFVLSMNLLVFICSLPALLLGWDGLGLVSFCLVIYYQNRKSLGAGMITGLMNRVGDTLLLFSIVIMFSMGHWNFLGFWVCAGGWLVCLMVVVAGMTKSAQMPFSSWLPAAMAAPTPVSALVHSSTLVTAGVFILIRFYPFLCCYEFFNSFLVFVSVVTMTMAGYSAVFEWDMKKVIALSTLSQLGMMMLALGMGMPYVALFHLYTHALFKALLFLSAGEIIHVLGGKQDMRLIGGVGAEMPLTVGCLNVANLSLCGVPFLSGFYSKDLILEALIVGPSGVVMVGMGVVASFLTVLYTVRLSFNILWGSGTESFSGISDENSVSTTPMIVLCSGALWSGCIFQSSFFSLGEHFVVSFWVKGGILVLVGVSFWLCFVGVLGGGSSVSYGGAVLWFSSSMWFLSSLSVVPMISWGLGMGHSVLKGVDQGWNEIVGGQGVLGALKVVSSACEVWVNKMLVGYMLFVLLVGVGVVFI